MSAGMGRIVRLSIFQAILMKTLPGIRDLYICFSHLSLTVIGMRLIDDPLHNW